MTKTTEYRFEFRITKDDETVLSGSTYVFPDRIDHDGSCESIEMELFSGLRAFRKMWLKEQEPVEEELPEEVDWDDSRDSEALEHRAEEALFRDR